MTKADPGGISENDSLFTSSLRLQSGYKRWRAFQRRRRATFSGGRVAKVEKRMERGKRRRRECVCWRTCLWWRHKSGAGESRQKFLKLQKKSFCSTGPSFSTLLYSLRSPNMSLLIARLCPALRRLSTPLRSIQQRGGGCYSRKA